MKKIFFIIIVFQVIQAQVGGNGTYAFLKLSQSARIEALGGNAISIYDNDLSVVFSNPSLLNKSMHNQVVTSANMYFANIGYGTFAYSRHWDKIGSFYAGFQFINYGDFIRADETGEKQGTFSAGDYTFNVGYSRPFFDSLLYIGANLKFVGSQYAEYNSLGLLTDIGATYVSKNKLTTVSAVFRNMGGQINTYTSRNFEKPPFEIHVGFSQSLKYVPIRLFVWCTNLQSPILNTVQEEDRFTTDPLTGELVDNSVSVGDQILRHFTIGAEIFPFKKHLFLRVAYNFQRAGEMNFEPLNGAVGLCYGIGLKINAISFSYSRAHYFMSQSPNHITLNIDLNRFLKKKTVVRSTTSVDF